MVNKVKSFLMLYLYWIQHSVFEEEVRGSEFQLIYKGLVEIINVEVDSFMVYELRMTKLLNCKVLMLKKHISMEYWGCKKFN